MQISNVRLYSFNFSPLKTPQFQSVHFAKKQDEINKNTQEAFDIARNLLLLGSKDLSTRNLQKFFDVKLEPIDKIKNPTTEIAAIDFKLSRKTGKTSELSIYVPELQKDTKMAKTVFVMNLAHEYTHAKQIKNNESAEELLFRNVEKSGFSPLVFCDLADYGKVCYRALAGDIMRSVTNSLLGEEGKISYFSTGGLTLINRNITADNISRVLGFSNETMTKMHLKRNLSSLDYIVNHLCSTNLELKEKCKINQEQTKSTIKNLLVEYCKNSSNSEKEAYLTENLIAKTQGFDDKTSELGYKFHKLMEEAFS